MGLMLYCCASVISMDISTAWPKSHTTHGYIQWIYPWISISTATLIQRDKAPEILDFY